MDVFAPPAARYLRFLHLIQEDQATEALSGLDLGQIHLLHAIAMALYRQKRLMVMQVTHLQPGISPATQHRRLKALKDKGFVLTLQDTQDQRVKYVDLTSKAQQYFDQLGRQLSRA